MILKVLCLNFNKEKCKCYYFSKNGINEKYNTRADYSHRWADWHKENVKVCSHIQEARTLLSEKDKFRYSFYEAVYKEQEEKEKENEQGNDAGSKESRKEENKTNG